MLILFFLKTGAVWGYPLDDLPENTGSSSGLNLNLGLEEAGRLSQTINQTISSFINWNFLNVLSGGEVSRLDPHAGSALTDLKFFKEGSFQPQDLKEALRAFLILFLQIAITVLAVVLGILKMVLEFMLGR